MILVLRYFVVHLLMLSIFDAIKDSGLPREEFKLKIGAFSANPWTENMRNEIEEKLGIKSL